MFTSGPDVDGRHFIDDVRQDVRYAWRTLRQRPAFTAVAVATLALGIGAAVSIFTVLDTVLLRPLPIRDPDRLAIIDAEEPVQHARVGASWTKFTLLRSSNTVFSDVAAYISREFTASVNGAPEQIVGMRVTYRFFETLGVAPALGRTFSADEDVENAAPVAIVTDAFFRHRLGGDPNAVGRPIRIEARDTPIVGVLPPGFRFQFADREPQVFLTSVFTPGALTAPQIRNGAGFLGYVGRLLPGVSLDRARAELASFDDHYRTEFANYTDAPKYRLHIAPFVDNLVGDVRPALMLLMAAVIVVLLVACANVAHLLLARGAERRREFAMRVALGASRSRIVRQLLAESLLLAVAGGVLGVVSARTAVAVIAANGPADIPRLKDAAPDLTVLAFAAAVACASAIIFGVLPAVRAGSVSPADALSDGRAGGMTSRASGRIHHWLATSEAAITVALLIVAMLLFESLARMHAVDPGFRPQNVYTTQVSLPRATYADPSARELFFTELLQRLRAAPGFTHVGATSYLPMSGANYGFFFYVEGQPRLGNGRDPTIAVRHVSADYFGAMGIPIRRGRAFTDRDSAGTPPVAIINETAAKKYFGNVDPVGRHLANSADTIMREVVGVVGDVRFDGPTRPDREELYLPYRQVPWPSMSIVVSSSLAVDAVASAIRSEVARLDRDQAVTDITPMARLVTASTTQQQFTSSMVGAFAAAAAVLAAIGLYAVVALFVTQRRQEFGIRMALGAQRSDVVFLVLGQGARMIAIGAAVGVLIGAAASRAIAGLLFGVTAAQPSAYLAGAAALIAIGLAACYLPARRATAANLVTALRAE